VSREKRHDSGKIVNNFSSVKSRAVRFGSDHVIRSEQSERETGNQIMPGMRENSRAQTVAMERQQTEEHAEDSEQNHSAHALIRKRDVLAVWTRGGAL
jgi:hypothetical protein